MLIHITILIHCYYSGVNQNTLHAEHTAPPPWYQITYNLIKELSFCHKLWFSNPFIFITLFRRPSIFQTSNTVRSGSVSLKYQRFPKLGFWDLWIWKFMFVAKTQFLFRPKVRKWEKRPLLCVKNICRYKDIFRVITWEHWFTMVPFKL